MKTKKTRILAAFLLAMLVVASGCALFDSDATPRAKFIDAQEAYIVVVQSLLLARDAGLIDEETYRSDILPIILEGDSLLDRMEIMVAQERFDEVELLRMSLLSIVLRLQAARL